MDIGICPDTNIKDIRFTFGPAMYLHPDKGWIEVDKLTDEERNRIFNCKSMYVKLVEVAGCDAGQEE